MPGCQNAAIRVSSKRERTLVVTLIYIFEFTLFGNFLCTKKTTV